ncbi:MAG: chemotaxis protein CheW [Clostridia bacterium]|nr:chemotaxis protein CheW [Clostridia bacterium]
MRGLSFYVNDELYMVDVTLVQKVARNMATTPIPAAPGAVVGIANIKGKIVTVLSLAVLLGRAQSSLVRATKLVSAVVLKPFAENDDQMGLLIDKPGDLITVDEKNILPPPAVMGAEAESCISGITEAEGKLYRIIDTNAIMNRFKDKKITNEQEGNSK